MLKLIYYGQNDGYQQPDVALVGDPGVDQPVLAAAGYQGGIICALATSATAGRGVVAVPCDSDTMLPYGVLLNGPGEFAGAIGPSGSKKVPLVRALFQGQIDSQAYDGNATSTHAFVAGAYVYCGGTTNSNVGKYTTSGLTKSGGTGAAIPVGICTHIPTASEPWLGVASLI